MISELKKSWQQFKNNEPGHRFQERYECHSGASRLSRVLTLVVGILMVLVGLASMPLPIPADGFLVPLGLVVVASEVKPAARFLDWAELKAREVVRKSLSLWSRASNVARALVVAVVVVAAAVLGYGAYSLVFGG